MFTCSLETKGPINILLARIWQEIISCWSYFEFYPETDDTINLKD